LLHIHFKPVQFENYALACAVNNHIFLGEKNKTSLKFPIAFFTKYQDTSQILYFNKMRFEISPVRFLGLDVVRKFVDTCFET
jgi:hypothetical protein